MSPQPERQPGDGVRFALMSGGGLGLAPVASGTFGTLAGIVLAVPLQLVCSGWILAAALAALAAILLWIGCSFTAFVERALPGRKDPGVFVLDEIVGYLAAIAIVAAVVGTPDVVAHAVTFVVFRFFDVTKIYPANRLEQLPGAPGIMLDDVAAGIYAGVVVAALYYFNVL